MKVLAFDFGSARTGVAVSDPTGTVARPVGIVDDAASERGIARVVELAQQEGVELIVVGLPITLRAEQARRRKRPNASSSRFAPPRTCPCRASTSASRPSWRAPLPDQGARGRSGRRAPVDDLPVVEEQPRYVRHRAGGGTGTRLPRGRRRARPGLRRPRRDCLALVGTGGGDGGEAAPKLRRRRRARRRSRSSRSSSRGLHARGDGVRPRRRADPEDKRNIKTSLSPAEYVRLTGKSTVPEGFPEDEGASPEAFSATVRVHGGHHHAQPARPAARGVCGEWAKIDMEYAESKNLTAYEVSIIASMIEEVLVLKERPPRRGGHLQPPARRAPARDRRHDSLRPRYRADGADSPERARVGLAVQHAEVRRSHSHADLEPDSRRCKQPRTPRTWITSTSSGRPTVRATSSPRARASF